MIAQFAIKLSLWAAAAYVAAQIIGYAAHATAFSVVGPIIAALQ